MPLKGNPNSTRAGLAKPQQPLWLPPLCGRGRGAGGTLLGGHEATEGATQRWSSCNGLPEGVASSGLRRVLQLSFMHF